MAKATTTLRQVENPAPAMPLAERAKNVPAMFRRAAIHAALGSARSFSSHLKKWRAKKEKAQAKGKKWTVRPPVPPRTWNKSTMLYAGQLHTPIEKQFASPGKIENQVTTNTETKICAVDLWRRINNGDEYISHLVSARIVQFAKQHEATILVLEHLGNLKPAKGKYSHRSNRKRAFWMKGRIFKYAKYKAYNQGILTSRVNPRNTSRECAHCHSLVARYEAGQPAEGYTSGAPLVLCPHYGMQGNADRNASLVIGQRLIARYQKPSQEKPPTPLATERVVKPTGVEVCQDATREQEPSILQARHADSNEHGTAQDEK
jgi:IS605 OrfB family transposase